MKTTCYSKLLCQCRW